MFIKYIYRLNGLLLIYNVDQIHIWCYLRVYLNLIWNNTPKKQGSKQSYTWQREHFQWTKMVTLQNGGQNKCLVQISTVIIIQRLWIDDIRPKTWFGMVVKRSTLKFSMGATSISIGFLIAVFCFRMARYSKWNNIIKNVTVNLLKWQTKHVSIDRQ